MPDLLVDFASLQSLTARIDNHLDRVATLLNDLQARIEALTGQWDGAASAGFRRTLADWFAAAEDLRTRLTGIRDLVTTAHDNHTTAVHTNTAMWRV